MVRKPQRYESRLKRQLIGAVFGAAVFVDSPLPANAQQSTCVLNNIEVIQILTELRRAIEKSTELNVLSAKTIQNLWIEAKSQNEKDAAGIQYLKNAEVLTREHAGAIGAVVSKLRQCK